MKQKLFLSFHKNKTFCFQAHVVCRQLGFKRALRATNASEFGVVSVNFAYDDVECQGTELRLDDCRHDDKENCNEKEGAGVVCDRALLDTKSK